MQATKSLDFQLTMGHPDNQQFLTDLNLTLTTDKTQISNIHKESQLKTNLNEDLKVVFMFHVEPQKQKDAIQYFEDAFNQDRDEDQMSPLQMPFKRPTSNGTVELNQGQGYITVTYVFYHSKVLSGEQEQMAILKFDEYEIPTLDVGVSLKGKISHNNKNRTNVKVDYVNVKVESDEMKPSNFSKLLKDTQALSEDDFAFMSKVPAFNLIEHLKRANFRLEMCSFREIKNYYTKAADNGKYEKQNKPFRYVNKGIFRKNVKCYGFLMDKLAVRAEADYNGEDVFIRLVKVYSKIIANML